MHAFNSSSIALSCGLVGERKGISLTFVQFFYQNFVCLMKIRTSEDCLNLKFGRGYASGMCLCFVLKRFDIFAMFLINLLNIFTGNV